MATNDSLAKSIEELFHIKPFADNDLAYLNIAINLIIRELKIKDADPALRIIWQKLADSLLELQAGIQPEMLTAERSKNPGLSPVKFWPRVIACVAISKAEKNQRREVCAKAARILKIPQLELWNFRKNMMKKTRNRIKSPVAHVLYQTLMAEDFVPSGTPGGIEPKELSQLNNMPTVEDWLKAIK
jgi:hypothetical protein